MLATVLGYCLMAVVGVVGTIAALEAIGFFAADPVVREDRARRFRRRCWDLADLLLSAAINLVVLLFAGWSWMCEVRQARRERKRTLREA